MNIIGVVKLARGQVGYYDDVTRIHLTIASPDRHVFAGMNTINLKRAVQSGRILLISGSLDAVEAAPEAIVVPVQATPIFVPAAEVKAAEPEIQEVAEIEEVVVIEESSEEAADEAPATETEEPVAEEEIEEEIIEVIKTPVAPTPKAPAKNNAKKKR